MNKNKITTFCPKDEVKEYLKECLKLPDNTEVVYIGSNGVILGHENEENTEEENKNDFISVLSSYFNQPLSIRKVIENSIDILNNAEDEQEYNMALHTIESALYDGRDNDETGTHESIDLEDLREAYRSNQKVRSECPEEAKVSDELDELGYEFSDNLNIQMNRTKSDAEYIRQMTKWSEYKIDSLLNGCQQYWPSSNDIVILSNIFGIAPFRLWPDWNTHQDKKN